MGIVINKDTMLERGKFIANGYTFIVKPVFLGEEDDYLSQLTVSPIPVSMNGETEIDKNNDKKMGDWIIALFSKQINKDNKKEHGKIYNFFIRIFHRKDYRYYSNLPTIQPLIMWLERKVTYKGRKVYFYDLERKFGLSKADIERLIIYFHELSGF